MSDAATASGHYFSRSWKMLTGEKGWYKPVLLLALSMFVPIVGMLAAMGYALEWARLTAWNVDSAPKQKGVKVGGCIVSGFRGAVIMLVWTIVWSIVSSVVKSVFSGSTVLYELIAFALAICALLYNLVAVAAAVRGAIYTKIGAGLAPVRVWEMLKRDYKGLFSVVGITFCSMLVDFVLVFVGVLIAILVNIGDVAQLLTLFVEAVDGYSVTSASVISVVGSIVSKCVPVLIIFLYLMFFVSAVTTLLTYNAVGLWMRQFDVARWGGPNEPLPEQDPALADNVAPVAPAAAQKPADSEPVAQPEPAADPAPVEQPAEPEVEKEPIPLPPISDPEPESEVPAEEPAGEESVEPVSADEPTEQLSEPEAEAMTDVADKDTSAAEEAAEAVEPAEKPAPELEQDAGETVAAPESSEPGPAEAEEKAEE